MSLFAKVFVFSRITAAREAAGLSLEQLGSRLGLPDAQAVTDLEAGRMELTPELVTGLMERLDQELEYFVNIYAYFPTLQPYFEAGHHKVRPLDPAFVQALHTVLDRGQVSARKAARLMELTLGELSDLFPAHGLASPFDL